jgi:transketolase
MPSIAVQTLTEKVKLVRRRVLETVAATGKGHIGGAFSCAEILVALYDGSAFRTRPGDPGWPGRDRFLMSKGHCGIALYALLAENGFFALEELDRIGREGAMLGEHPDHRTPGIESDAGSLGNGLGIGAGMAFADRMDGKERRVVVLLGDGECYEGAVWEAAQFAAHHRLAGLTAIVDLNGQCVLDYTRDCNDFGDMAGKWRAFGWQVLEADGHDFPDLLRVLETALGSREGPPTAIIARTVKGKGVSFMEGALKWHHGVPQGAELEQARRELAS